MNPASGSGSGSVSESVSQSLSIIGSIAMVDPDSDTDPDTDLIDGSAVLELADLAGENLHQLRIVAGAGPALQLVQGIVEIQGGAVALGVGDGVEGLRDGHDPGAQRD